MAVLRIVEKDPRNIIDEALRDPEAQFALQAIAAEGLHVDYGVAGVWWEEDERRVHFYAFVTTLDDYRRLVRNENHKYEKQHNSDPRFAGRPPGPGEAYEPSAELSLGVMRRQPTFVGYQESLPGVLAAATARYIERRLPDHST